MDVAGVASIVEAVMMGVVVDDVGVESGVCVGEVVDDTGKVLGVSVGDVVDRNLPSGDSDT